MSSTALSQCDPPSPILEPRKPSIPGPAARTVADPGDPRSPSVMTPLALHRLVTRCEIAPHYKPAYTTSHCFPQAEQLLVNP
ncbi:hypothetical protein BD289DRAFT_431367 [Coniella lustricola]|uniref:Uncharacterized protein n=1 Tax=Coniella lustricola TaxID=2025994 RepID=A0A2T3AAY9_9PEZI|nr:hypothetical protein BD289DRAFT_431367 [Coniella lustricola]